MKSLLTAAAMIGVMVTATANATTFTVDSLTDSIAAPQDTGLNLDAGTTYNFAVLNASTTFWSAGDTADRSSTAAGIDPSVGYGTYTQNGFTANYGALVGEVGSSYFLIGTGTTETGLAGDLKLIYWDSFYPDNSGTQTLTVSAVPLPGALPLLGMGIAGLVAFGARRRRAA